MANEKKRYQQTTYGNVAYDLNYQRNVVPVPDGGEPSRQPQPRKHTRTGTRQRRRVMTRPLTGEELAFFNTEFFNHDTDVDGVVRANPHNQFLTCLYNVPQEINLYDLFYDGGGVREAPSQEELERNPRARSAKLRVAEKVPN